MQNKIAQNILFLLFIIFVPGAILVLLFGLFYKMNKNKKLTKN